MLLPSSVVATIKVVYEYIYISVCVCIPSISQYMGTQNTNEKNTFLKGVLGRHHNMLCEQMDISRQLSQIHRVWSSWPEVDLSHFFIFTEDKNAKRESIVSHRYASAI